MHTENRIITSFECISVRNELLENQQFICPICLTKIDGDSYLDHDHETGFIRAAVHPWCNTGLGFIERRIKEIGHEKFFETISNYIITHRKKKNGIVYPSKGQQKRFETKRVRQPRLLLTQEEKERFKLALREGAIVHPNPKKNTSREGSWRRTADKYNLPYDRLLAYVNGLRPVDELD